MSDFDPNDLTGFLNDLCDAAACETLPRFRAEIDVINKVQGDFDPVTQADKEAEHAIRSLISSKFPEHGIVGEEFGTVNSHARYQWIIDPVDGTRAFISGVPVWGTLIGLYDNGKPVAGVMDQPFTRERYIAANGTSTLQLSKETVSPLTTGTTASVSQATLMTTSPHLLDNDQDRRYFCLERQVKLFRYGCDCYAYCLLASGQIDLVVESGLNVYDIAALIPIIENAGGIVTDWQGESAAEGGQILAAANRKIHQEAVEILTG